MSTDEQESFIRWQGRSIEQLGFVNNLLMGLATGLLAFQTQLAFDDKINFTITEKWLATISIFLVFLSLTVGCYVAWNRLRSFNLTAQVARKRETNKRDGIEQLRNNVKGLDNKTWLFIQWQTGLFAFGGLLLFIVAVLRYLG